MYEAQWQSGTSRGTGREARTGHRSGIYFCEQAGVMLSLGRMQMDGSNKMQVSLIIFSNYTHLN